MLRSGSTRSPICRTCHCSLSPTNSSTRCRCVSSYASGPSWRERRIGLAGDELVFGLGAALPQPALAHRLEDTRDGDLVEYCPSAGPVVSEIGGRIADYGGAALIIDYGDWRSLGDTLQALQRHRQADPLADPGSADLTAHVDFEALAQAVPCAHTRLTPQGVFLERLGITARAQSLAAKFRGTERRPACIRASAVDAPRGNGKPVQSTWPLSGTGRAATGTEPMTLEILTSDQLGPVRHGFFTRRGGASSGVFEGLNCGLGSTDQREIVEINRNRVAAALGVPPENLLAVHQVHSADAICVDDRLCDRPRADAIVTATPGLALSVLTADCQPVLFHDPRAGVIGAAHAGWRGALDGILEATLEAMEESGRTSRGYGRRDWPHDQPARLRGWPGVFRYLYRRRPRQCPVLCQADTTTACISTCPPLVCIGCAQPGSVPPNGSGTVPIQTLSDSIPIAGRPTRRRPTTVGCCRRYVSEDLDKCGVLFTSAPQSLRNLRRGIKRRNQSVAIFNSFSRN